MFFLDQLADGPQNGTKFDCDVLDTLKALDNRWTDNPKCKPLSEMG